MTYLHCRACFEAKVPQDLAVRVDEESIEILCENHKEDMLVCRYSLLLQASEPECGHPDHEDRR